jgi:uncharacterized protein YndB with AHSA1/START domain
VGDTVLVVRRVLKASAEFLFDAWTDPTHMARWFHARPDWTTEVRAAEARAGGAWEIIMHAPDGSTCHPLGRYLELDRPRRIVFTWRDDPGDARETVVTIELKPLGPHETELILTQTGLRDVPDQEDHQNGWEGCLQCLTFFIASE